MTKHVGDSIVMLPDEFVLRPVKERPAQVDNTVSKPIAMSFQTHVLTMCDLTRKQAMSVISDYPRDVPGNWPLHIVLDYPIDGYVVVTAGPRAWTTGEILWFIAQAYKRVYEDPDMPGVWGHDIGDLVIEGLNIHHAQLCDGWITVAVGS